VIAGRISYGVHRFGARPFPGCSGAISCTAATATSCASWSEALARRFAR
jgi:hypothetical protein